MRPIKWNPEFYSTIGCNHSLVRPLLRRLSTHNICRMVVGILLLATLLPSGVFAQSGRRRATSPGTETAPPPAPPVAVPEATVVTNQEQVGDITSFKLRNGMTVIINEMHAMPLVTVLAYVRLGQLNGEGLETARTIEFALGRSTDAKPSGGIAREIARLGAISASNSTVDHTEYSITSGASSLYDILSIQADIIQHSKLDSAILAEAFQQAAIRGEERCPDPSLSGFDRVSTMLADGREPDWASSITPAQAADFYAAHYRPENLIVVVSGDATTFETLVQIERLYGQFGVPAAQDTATQTAPAGGSAQPSQGSGAATVATQTGSGGRPSQISAYPPPPPPEPRFSYNQRRGDVSQAVVTAGFRAPGYDSQDWPAMFLLSSLLGQGRGSMLSQALLLDQGLVGRVDSTYRIGEQSGVLALQMFLPPASLDKAEAALFKQVADLVSAGPGPQDLARAKSRAELSFQTSMAFCADRAGVLASLEAGGQPAALPIDYVEKIRAVTPESARRTAQKYLTIENLSIDEALPGSAPARTLDERSLKQMVLGWGPSLSGTASAGTKVAATRPQPQAPAPGPQPLTPAEQQEVDSESIQPLPVKDFSTLNGPQAFVREDHTSPVVTLALLFQGGRVTEDGANGGITELMLRSMFYGTTRLSSSQLAVDLDQLGASVDIINEPDFFGMELSVMSANAGAALKWLRNVTEEPAFRDPDVERAKTEQISAIRQANDNANQRAHDLLFNALFGGYSYGIPAHGAEDSVAKFKPDQIRDWYNHTIKTQYPLIVIVGDTEGSALVSEGIAGQFPRRELAKTFQAKIPKNVAPSEQTETRNCPVSIVDLGFQGPKMGSDDLPILDVIATLLNLTWSSLPDASGDWQSAPADLVVSTSPMLAGGAVWARLATSAQDEAAARRAFVALGQKLAAKGVTEQESLSARAVAAMKVVDDLARPRERAIEYARSIFTRRDAAYVDAYPDRLSKIRSVDVMRLLQTYFKSPGLSAGTVRGSVPAPKSPPATAPVAAPPSS